MSKNRLTFFDADRTLFHGPSTEWALKHLAHEGLLDAYQDTLRALDRLNNPGGDQLPYIREVGRVFASLVETVPEDDLRRVAAESAKVWRARVFEAMDQKVAMEQNEGPVLVVSHGPDDFIRPFGELLGADGACGRTLEDYREQRKPPKTAMASLACHRAGITWDWGTPGYYVTAYGDAPDDVQLLQKADEAILVNPMNEALRRQGVEADWPIIDCAEINEFGNFGYLEGNLARLA